MHSELWDRKYILPVTLCLLIDIFKSTNDISNFGHVLYLAQDRANSALFSSMNVRVFNPIVQDCPHER